MILVVRFMPGFHSYPGISTSLRLACILSPVFSTFVRSYGVDFTVHSTHLSCLCAWPQPPVVLPFTFALSLRTVLRPVFLANFGWTLWMLWTFWTSLPGACFLLPRSTHLSCPGPNYCNVSYLPWVQEGAIFSITGTNPLWFPSNFDSSLGFPGEGPGTTGQMKLSVVTANIGSLKKNTFWSTCGDDIICLQETRIGKNNVRSSSKDVQACNLKLYHGGLLPGILQSNGIVKSGAGGTAILAYSEFVTPLDPSSCTIYQSLYASKRVVAVWVQVAPKVQLLVFSIYAKTAASKFPEVHAENNHLLELVFECAAQYGPVPVIVCGDFQLNPSHYASVSAAVNNHSWIDPAGPSQSGRGPVSTFNILQ